MLHLRYSRYAPDVFKQTSPYILSVYISQSKWYIWEKFGIFLSCEDKTIGRFHIFISVILFQHKFVDIAKLNHEKNWLFVELL